MGKISAAGPSRSVAAVGAACRRKIVHLTSIPETLTFLVGQAAFLREHGFDLHAVSSPGRALDAFSAAEQVPVWGVEMPRRINPVRDARSVTNLVILFRRLSPQIVHAHTPKAGVVGMCAAYLAGVPVRIFHIHGFPHLTATGLQRRLLHWATWLSCRLATRVLAVSQSTRAVAIESGFGDATKIHVPANGSINGVDAERRFNPRLEHQNARHEFRHGMGLDERAFVVAFVGRIAVDKGMAELAEAWAVVRRERPEARLIIAGGRDERDPLPPALEKRLFSQSSVTPMGWLDDTRRLYGAVDLLVLPSYREGFSVVLLEASAMELPIVASAVTGCLDAVVDGKTGTLVPVHDPGALAAAILRYAADPDLRALHGQTARARVLADFQPRSVWYATLEHYQNELQHRVPSGGRFSRGLKRALDIAMAAAGLLALAPLLAAITLAIRLTMKEPALFEQTRTGAGETLFRLYKFCTMRTIAGADGLPLPDADRLTKLGRFLRNSSLDELPQLWNVLRGEMSLVGPRPLLPEYLPRYTSEQRRRHRVPPGITGWAQVHGRNAITWEQKFALDNWYVDHQSFWLDCKILLLTLAAALGGAGVRAQGHATMPEFLGTAGER